MTWHPARRLPSTRPRAAKHVNVCDCPKCACCVEVPRAGAVCPDCQQGQRCRDLNKLEARIHDPDSGWQRGGGGE